MQFRSLPGLTSYEDARRLQLELVDQRSRGEIGDTILFLEHEPVITRGRGLQFTGEPRPRHMPFLAPPPGVQFAESERGGDLTYHGPGQLVIYPIVKLDGSGFGPNHDIAAFLRKFERVLIDLLREEYGLEGESRENATGVWVRDPRAAAGTSGRKIASIGIAVRKWVTYHGMAVNCVNDLAPFHAFSPCGFNPEVMTRLVDLLPAERAEGFKQNWRAEVERLFARGFEKK